MDRSSIERKSYLIEYTAKSKDGAIIVSGTMRVKNCTNEFEAQAKFENWLKKKYPNFGQLIVHKCSVDNPLNAMFGDIFGEDVFS